MITNPEKNDDKKSSAKQHIFAQWKIHNITSDLHSAKTLSKTLT